MFALRAQANRSVDDGQQPVVTATTVAPQGTQAPDLLGWLRAVVSVAFVLALVLGLISANLRSLVTDRQFMLAGFRDNGVAQTTGLDDAQLGQIADAFIAYFQSPPGRLQMDVVVNGAHRPLFNEREVEHMEDVQRLIQLFLNAILLVAVVCALRVVTALALERSVVAFGRDMMLAVAVMVAIVILVGVLSLADFTELWTRFHQVAFRNDLWQLDPSRDYLIMLFPEPFWYASTIRLATGIAVESLLLAVAGFLAWRFG